MDFELSELESRQETFPESQKLYPAILASLLFHGMLVAIFLNGQISGQNADRLVVSPSSVSVRLYPRNPQTPQALEPVLSMEESAIPPPLEPSDSSSEELLSKESPEVAELIAACRSL